MEHLTENIRLKKELEAALLKADRFRKTLQKIANIPVAPSESNGLVREIRGMAKKALAEQSYEVTG